jgi:hypothetical protein
MADSSNGLRGVLHGLAKKMLGGAKKVAEKHLDTKQQELQDILKRQVKPKEEQDNTFTNDLAKEQANKNILAKQHAKVSPKRINGSFFLPEEIQKTLSAKTNRPRNINTLIQHILNPNEHVNFNDTSKMHPQQSSIVNVYKQVLTAAIKRAITDKNEPKMNLNEHLRELIQGLHPSKFKWADKKALINLHRGLLKHHDKS